LVERMCSATKSRFADEILAIAQLEPSLGSVAIGRWLAGCPQLQEILRAAAPRSAWPKITRYAVFAVESQVCSRHLMWSEQRDILRRSMLAELTGRGLAAEYMDALLACAKANLPRLNDHRRQVMEEAPS
jgi:hypothetical protein